MRLINGDCIEVMKTLDENSVDTIICDPPYGLNFMGKDWDKFGQDKNPAGGDTGKDTPYARNRVAPAFYHYGLEEKNTLQDFSYRWGVESLRVAKPGAFMLCFGGTRTFHRIACGLEDAGWEIRDTIMWIYGSGFPKSYNISKGIDKKAGAKREVSRINPHHSSGRTVNWGSGEKYGIAGKDSEGDGKKYITAPATDQAKKWDGWGTALKPAFEPIIVCMKPRDGTFVENALKWGVAGLNIDGGRVPLDGTENLEAIQNGRIYGDGVKYGKAEQAETTSTYKPEGRWPANIIHDGSEEVLAGFPNGSNRYFYCAKASKAERNAGLEGMEELPKKTLGEYRKPSEGRTASKSGSSMKNNHPTVKPLSLMVYLCKLTKTPSGGVVLDPFMGSGTTGMACKKTGREFIGIELDEHYFEIAEKRIESVKQVELL